MLVSEDHKFVYFAPKKTGSTSVRTLLQEHYGAVIWRDYPDPKFKDEIEVSPDWRSPGPDWKHVCHMPEQFADYFKFSTVRSPFTLEKSRYRHDMRHHYYDYHVGFERFVRRLLTAKIMPTLFRKLHQEPEYQPIAGCIPFKLDAILRLEHLQEDLEKLPFWRQGMKVGHLHKSSRVREPQYTWKAYGIVRKCYQEDFEAFGYDPLQDMPFEVSLL